MSEKTPTLASIKRRANQLVRDEKVPLASALQRAAKEAGFASYQIANNKLRNRR